MDIQHAIALAATTREPDLHQLHVVAVARGGNNTGCTAEEEREFEWPRLITLALLRTVDLALDACLLDVHDDLEEVTVDVRAISDASAGALRLAYRALEVHAREVGYQTDAWVEEAVVLAAAQLGEHATNHDEDFPVAFNEVRAATASLACATERNDRMLLPEQLAEGLGHLLTLYAIARAAAG